MKKLYDIILNQEVAGKAFVEESGMYYLISCEVESKASIPPTIELEGTETTITLGGCYPDKNGYRLKTRVRKQILQETGYSFVAHLSQKGTIVDINKPVHFLQSLERSKIITEGTYKKIYCD